MDSPTPESRDKAYSMQLRADIDIVVEEGLEETLLDTVSSNISVMTGHFTHVPDPHPGYVEHRLHDLWYACIQAAKNLDSGGYLQDGLLRQLLLAKALGPLHPPANRTVGVTFSDGHTIWSGLPLFAQDLGDEFTSRYYERRFYTSDQRENLAGFLGRLLSVGHYDGPALCMLSLFREILEVSRPLVADQDSTEIPLDELLPALGKMLGNAGYSLSILASNHSTAPLARDYPCLSALGELAVQAGNIPSSGYSPERWRFWMSRLEELSQCRVSSIEHDTKLYREWMVDEQDVTRLL